MKNYKVILVTLLLGIIVILVFNGVLYLKQQDTLLLGSIENNLNQIGKKLADFESKDIIEESIALKAENAILKQQIEELKIELAQLTQEREAHQLKSGPIAQPQEAIKELKTQMRKVGAEIKKRMESESIAEGNRGFLIKDGKSTNP